MKKNLLSILVISMLFLLVQSFKNNENTSDYYSPIDNHQNIMYRSNGAAASGLGDRTGGPLSSGSTCAQCHSGANFSPTITLTITDNLGAPITNYVAGEEYNLSFTINSASGNPAGYGMQATALLEDNSAAGTFSTPSSNAQVTPFNGRSYFEQNATSGTPTFTSNWTAPSVGTGAVTFYFVGNAVNGNGSTSGDHPSPAATLTLNETLSTSDFAFQKSIILEQNPVKDALKINLTENYETIALEIFDISGKSIYAKNYTNVSAINEQISLSSGVYFVKLKNEANLKATLKLIKE